MIYCHIIIVNYSGDPLLCYLTNKRSNPFLGPHTTTLLVVLLLEGKNTLGSNASNAEKYL
jgi:hypothetical protein